MGRFPAAQPTTTQLRCLHNGRPHGLPAHEPESPSPYSESLIAKPTRRPTGFPAPRSMTNARCSAGRDLPDHGLATEQRGCRASSCGAWHRTTGTPANRPARHRLPPRRNLQGGPTASRAGGWPRWTISWMQPGHCRQTVLPLRANAKSVFRTGRRPGSTVGVRCGRTTARRTHPFRVSVESHAACPGRPVAGCP